MRRSSCFVPGCVSGYAKTKRENKIAGRKNPSMFMPPKNGQLFEEWKRVIHRKDRELSARDVVCDLHFEKDCIETHYLTKLPDGTIHMIPKRHVLKEGSVPTIFSNLPAYISNQTHKRKAPVPRPCISQKKLRQLNDEDCIDSDVSQQSKEFFYLTEEIKNISLPNSWWTVGCTNDYIIFAKWDSKFCSERRVVICKDLSTKIFLRQVEVSLTVEGYTMGHISLLLQKVNDLKICEKAYLETSSGCSGFVESKHGILCSACSKSSTQVNKNAAQPKIVKKLRKKSKL